LGGLGTTYNVYLGLIGEHVVDFLLVLTELFPLGVTAEALRAKIDRKSAISLQCGQFDQKFQVKGVTPTNHSYQKTRRNDLLYGIKIWTDCSSVLAQSTRLTDRRMDRLTDRQTERQTDGQSDRILIARPRLYSTQRGKNSKCHKR